MLDLSVSIGNLELQNPIMTASGTFGYGQEYEEFIDLNKLGAIVTKAITLKPKKGNPPPRVAETTAGMLNAIGLQNVGVEAFIRDKLPYLRTLNCKTVVNIAGKDAEDYVELAKILSAEDGVDALEVNISCPNVKKGGQLFGSDAEIAQRLVAAVRDATDMHLMVKLTPNVTDITEIAKAVERAGADSISLINTLLGIAVDVRTRKPLIANITGGLSGPAIKPVALACVWNVAKAVDIPLVGIGGIMTADDGLEFMVVGASAFQVGTANFVEPTATLDILNGIETFCEEESIDDITQLIGTFEEKF
jgi:dihydroorotate dehydrogenase (NAD+) catalytic subunit